MMEKTAWVRKLMEVRPSVAADDDGHRPAKPKRREKRRERCSAYQRRRATFWLKRRFRRPSGMADSSRLDQTFAYSELSAARIGKREWRPTARNGVTNRAGRNDHRTGTTSTPKNRAHIRKLANIRSSLFQA